MDGGMDDRASTADGTHRPNALPCEANALLRLLNDADRAALAPHLELVPFRNGDMIARAGDEADSICFPLTGICCWVTVDGPMMWS
jgi:hypothetical protein